MLFNSIEFICYFLPIVFAIYFILNRQKYFLCSTWFLVLASLFFYAWWNPVYLPLILCSAFFNYFVGCRLSYGNSKHKQTILLISILANIMLLGYFKYMDFFIDNINLVLKTQIKMLNIILPLGISFFTFTQIAYLVDCAKDKVKESKLVNYLLFVTFFPHLLAGPILHHADMMPQFANSKNKSINYSNIALGLFLFTIGLFKKCCLADVFALWANNGFANTAHLTLIEGWSTSLSYTFQLYFDFSGYTDMAIAAALFFNIKLPINFNSPYKATSIQDFWHRWHMTLSAFLRDYLYIPLGGNRCGVVRTYLNLIITFVLGGLWHGAGWTFIIWGLLHGLALVIHRIWGLCKIKLNKVFAWFITFNFINLTWVFFRANSLQDAINIISSMFGKNGIYLPAQIWGILPAAIKKIIDSKPYLQYAGDGTVLGTVEVLFMMVFALALVLIPKNSNELTIKKMSVINIFIFYFVVQALFFSQTPSEFLYFRF